MDSTSCLCVHLLHSGYVYLQPLSVRDPPKGRYCEACSQLYAGNSLHKIFGFALSFLLSSLLSFLVYDLFWSRYNGIILVLVVRIHLMCLWCDDSFAERACNGGYIFKFSRDTSRGRSFTCFLDQGFRYQGLYEVGECLGILTANL